MIYLPPLRRFLPLTALFLFIIILYRGLISSKHFPSFVFHPPPIPPPGIHVPVSAIQKPLPFFNSSDSHTSLPNDYLFNLKESQVFNTSASTLWQPALNPDLAPLFQCLKPVNPHTGHIRLANIVQNISEIPPDPSKSDSRIFWNPTIIALPFWSKNQYLVVSRILTDGNHQENVLCEANICHATWEGDSRKGERRCTPDDLKHVGSTGGMRCATPPITLSVPPTPAEKCEGKFGTYVDIPGFHDPRLFWSGKGEPLMMVNTQSRYACFGLWVIDLRSLYTPLQNLLSSSPTRPSLGPLKSYPTLTELTRNPPSTRFPIEKNWLLFFPSNGESYVQYELPSQFAKGGHTESRGRTFAKLLGNGLTTTNLTDPRELSCLEDHETSDAGPKSVKNKSLKGTWHQATNSLRLILCKRADPTCHSTPAKTIFFAIIHRKFPNELDLPLRYERFVISWSGTAPFRMIGISAHPLLLYNETATGWSAAHNWVDNDADPMLNSGSNIPDRQRKRSSLVHDHSNTTTTSYSSDDNTQQKSLWAYFTYTVSIAYAWGREPKIKGGLGNGNGDEAEDMHVGYLDDEVILGIGVDDEGQAFSRVLAEDLVSCMRACPGRIAIENGSNE